jgi:hypothetical protein
MPRIAECHAATAGPAKAISSEDRDDLIGINVRRDVHALDVQFRNGRELDAPATMIALIFAIAIFQFSACSSTDSTPSPAFLA